MNCKLPESLQAWDTPAFVKTLKYELRALPAGTLPLDPCTRQGGMVDDSDISATVLGMSSNPHQLRIRLGVFFQERVGGCSCHDDPVAENAYGELLLLIDRCTAMAEFQPAPD